MTQAINCHHCGEFIDTILSDKPIITYHVGCHTESCEDIKEGGIRIGMRIHESKDLNSEEGNYINYD